MSFQQFVIGGVFGFSAVILPQLALSDADQASWIGTRMLLIYFLKNIYSTILKIIQPASYARAASLPLLLSPVGSLLFGYMSDRFGRKISLQLTYVPLLLSWALLSNAQCLNDIYLGRLLAGFATGQYMSLLL